MKTLLKFLLILFVVIGYTACDDDDDYDYKQRWAGFGLVDLNEIDGSFTIVLDDGEVLYPLNIYDFGVEDGDRVLVTFTIEKEYVSGSAEEYDVYIYSIRDILFKGILDITAAIEDSIGNDPVDVHEIWQTDNMLTFEISTYGSSVVHYINLVKEPGELTSDSQPVLLELRHNDNNDTPLHRLSSYVTFDLSAIQIDGQDSTSYSVSWIEYGGEEHTYEGVFYY